MKLRFAVVGPLLILLLACLRADAQSCSYASVSCGETVAQRLENSNCQFADSNRPFYGFTFNAVSGQVLDIYLTSDSFPPLVAIYEPGNNYPAAYDDGLSTAWIRYDVVRTGTYRILTAADNAARSGLFRLSVYCQTVCRRPFVASPVTSASVPSGGRATLMVTADGTPPLRYRWFDQANPSATLSSAPPPFTTPPLFATTVFGIEVSNNCGTVNSTVAFVTVEPCTSPVITQQPRSESVNRGEFVTLEVKARGSTLQYQWYRGVSGDTKTPVPYLGTGGNTFTLIADPSSVGSYWVRVSNACGSIDSVAAAVEIPLGRRRAVRK